MMFKHPCKPNPIPLYNFILQAHILGHCLLDYQATNFKKLFCISFINLAEHSQYTKLLIWIA